MPAKASVVPRPPHPQFWKPLLCFVGLSLAFSWVLWWPRVFDAGLSAVLSARLHLVGSLGPALAAVLTVLLWCPEWRKGFFSRLLHFRAPALSWLVALSPLLVLLLLVGMAPPATRPLYFQVAEYPLIPFGLLLLYEVVFYGVGEELGWRGWLYPHFKTRGTPFQAALWVAPVWAFWHLPLLLGNLTYQGMGMMLVGWVLSLLAGAFLTAWLYEVSRGSIPVLAVFHGLLDVAMINQGVTPLVLNVLGGFTTVAGVLAALWLWRLGKPGTSPSTPPTA